MNIERLKDLLLMPDDYCQQYLSSVLANRGMDVTIGSTGTDFDYIFATPKDRNVIPVLLMAHWDTKRETTGKLADEPVTLFMENGKIENASGILGADDRAGIAMILEVLDTYNELPMVLFTNHEETGGAGMKSFLSAGWFDEWKDVTYLTISVDRRGHNQFVRYYTSSDTSLEYLMQSLGYVEEKGIWTDGSCLAEKYDLAHVNVSYGGYNPHSADEFILLDSYVGATRRLCKLVERVDKKYPRAETRIYTSYYWGNSTKKTITPSSNAGQGTAAYDRLPQETTLMVHQPAHAPLQMRLPMHHCEVCGRRDRETWYSTGARMFLCFSCSNRLHNKYHRITREIAMKGIEDLKKDRLRSREINILTRKQADIRRDFPCCPKCKKRDHVSWSRKTAGFVCTECALAHDHDPDKFFWNGQFWVISGTRKVFVTDGIVTETDWDSSHLLRTCPVGTHEFIQKCEMCGYVGGTVRPQAMWHNLSGKKVNVNLCHDCRADFGDLVDDYEDSRAPVIDVGSEDLAY